MAGIDVLNTLRGYAIDFGSNIPVVAAVTLDASACGKIITCQGTTADYIVTLPLAATCAGKTLSFVMAPALTKLVTLAANGTETINGATTRIMWANEAVTLFCDGYTWAKIAGVSLPMAVRMYKDYASSFGIANATLTKVEIDTTAVASVASMADTANFKAIIQRAGLYSTVARLSWNPAATYNHLVSVRVYKNGSSIQQQYGFYFKTVAPNGLIDPQITDTIVFAKNDYLELYCYQAGSTSEVFQLYGPNPDAHFIHLTEVVAW